MQPPIVFRPHSLPQEQALRSTSPITLLATGIQYGKTSVLALSMKIAMHTYTSPEDNFLMVAPTYKILQQATLPAFLKLMDGYGEYHRQDAYFQMNGGGKCYMRTSTDPDSIVGITSVRHCVADECGLMSLYFWENLQARAAFKNARIVLGTSPYTLNWVFKELIRPKQKNANARPDVLYLKARSIDNPYFPRDYYERMRATMDEGRFRAMFGGEWEKMEGLVYKCFDEEANTITPFALPPGTKYYAGVDWGTTAPFAMLLIAKTPTNEYFQVSEVYKTGLTLLDMIQIAKQKMQAYDIKMFYCDPSQPGYIAEFSKAGIPAVGADNDIKVGIDLVYGLIASRRFKLFRGDNKYTEDEMSAYHYPSPTEVDADTKVVDTVPVKQDDHACFPGYVCVETETGPMPISGLKVGTKILTPKGFYPVTGIYVRGQKLVYKYQTDFGKELSCTNDHKVFSPFKGIVEASCLSKKTKVWCITEESIRRQRALTTDVLKRLTVKGHQTYTGKFISIIMGQSLKALLFTMLTTILITTQLKILGLWSKANTLKFTLMSLKRRKLPASFAGSKLELKDPTGVDIVRLIVRLRLDAEAVWMMLKRLVHSVTKNLFPINTKTTHIAASVVSARCLAEKQIVYDLTVDGVGCFYADGFLVSNCDALRYCLISIYTGDHRKAPQIHNPNEQRKLSIAERMDRIRRPSARANEGW